MSYNMLKYVFLTKVKLFFEVLFFLRIHPHQQDHILNT